MISLPNFLLQPLFWVAMLLLFAVWQFIRNKLRMDIVALLVMTCFSLSGILSVQEIFAGLSDPNVVLIALLFVVGEGLVRTGIALQVSNWLMRVSGASETRVLVLLMLCIAGLGSFMSSTGIVAIFIPVVMAICSGMNISPKRLMMPLSVAGLISGMMTLIATPPNLIAHSELLHQGFNGLNFFSFTPIGLTVLAIGIVYMLLVRKWLDRPQSPHTSTPHPQEKFSSMPELIKKYRLEGAAKMVLIEPHSAFVGKTIDELKLRRELHLNVIAIQRAKGFRRLTLSAFGETSLHAKDVLLINSGVSETKFDELCMLFHLKPIELKEDYFSDHSKSIGMAEIALMPEANAIGKSVSELGFRSTYGLSVAGIKRGEEIIHEIIHEPLRFGDVLLVMGLWQHINQFEQRNKDFFLLNTPVEQQQAVPAASQAPYALLAVSLMVLLMITGVVPNVIAALIACLILGKFRCVDAKSAYEAIHFPSLILIVGMMPFSIALQKTGGVQLVVDGLLDLTQNLGAHGVMFGLFILTAIINAFISNTATAILVMPIAIAIATKLGYSPIPFAMLTAVAASAAFITPVSSPVNTMILAPSGYRFIDFVKVGLPFTFIVMLVSVYLIPLFFPF